MFGVERGLGLVCPRRGGRHRGRHGDAPPPSVDRSAGRRLDTVAAFTSRPHPRPPRYCEPSVSPTPRGEVARKYRVGKLPRPSRPRPAPPPFRAEHRGKPSGGLAWAWQAVSRARPLSRRSAPSIGDWCLGVCALPPPLPPPLPPCAPREPCALRGLGAWTARAVRPPPWRRGCIEQGANTTRARARDCRGGRVRGYRERRGNGVAHGLRTQRARVREARFRRLDWWGGASAVAARIGGLGAGFARVVAGWWFLVVLWVLRSGQNRARTDG